MPSALPAELHIHYSRIRACIRRSHIDMECTHYSETPGPAEDVITRTERGKHSYVGLRRPLAALASSSRKSSRCFDASSHLRRSCDRRFVSAYKLKLYVRYES